MAFSKTTLSKLANLLKVKEADIEAAVKDEKEVDLPIDEHLQTFTADELTTVKKNSYESGKTAGVEISIKDIKEEMGLDFQGKTLKGLLDAHGKKVIADAKIEPDKKVSELQAQVDTLKKTVGTFEQQIAEKDKEVASVKTKATVAKHIPSLGDSGFNQDDVLNLMLANGYAYELNDKGAVVFSRNGEKLNDRLGEPVKADEVIAGFMKEKKIIVEAEVPGGRGGNGSGKQTPTFKKLSEVKEYYKTQGKSELGEEFRAEVMKLKEADKEFDFSA